MSHLQQPFLAEETAQSKMSGPADGAPDAPQVQAAEESPAPAPAQSQAQAPSSQAPQVVSSQTAQPSSSPAGAGAGGASPDGVLLPYRGTTGRMTAAASLLIPFGVVLFFAGICLAAGEGDEYSLDAALELSTFTRVVMVLHAGYFIILPFSFELDIEYLPFRGCPEQYRFGKIPPRPDNLFWMMSCLAGELFFVVAVLMFLLAAHAKVPRWTLIVAMAQCSYNMKNSLFWVFLGKRLSPIKTRMSIMVIDFVYIGFCFAVYIACFFQ